MSYVNTAVRLGRASGFLADVRPQVLAKDTDTWACPLPARGCAGYAGIRSRWLEL